MRNTFRIHEATVKLLTLSNEFIFDGRAAVLFLLDRAVKFKPVMREPREFQFVVYFCF